jgi:hypothetical protein
MCLVDAISAAYDYKAFRWPDGLPTVRDWNMALSIAGDPYTRISGLYTGSELLHSKWYKVVSEVMNP